MPSMKDIALGIIAKNPRVASNPQAQALMSVIQSEDARKGEEIARNICKSMGVSEQDAVKQASQFFNVPM